MSAGGLGGEPGLTLGDDRRPALDLADHHVGARAPGPAGGVEELVHLRGGIGKKEDLLALAALRQVNLGGVVVGKALYEHRFTIAEGQAALAPR